MSAKIYTILYVWKKLRIFMLMKNAKKFFIRFVALATLVYHLLFLTSIRTIQSYILSSFVICRDPSSCIFIAPLSKTPRGAEPRIELGPALQQADALPTELRRTLKNAKNLSLKLQNIKYLNVEKWEFFHFCYCFW